MGSALLAAGATMGLAGCSANEQPSGEQTAAAWDKQADVVVVGTGTAATAAIAASHYGAESVIILEKTETFGGTTIFSGQGMGIPLTRIHAESGVTDTLEDVLAYYQSASGGRADLSVGESYATNGDKFLKWLEDAQGCTIGFLAGLGQKFYGDYYEPNEGYLGIGRNPLNVVAIAGEEEGTSLWSFYKKKIEADEKIELLMSTEATRLVTDDAGAVIGLAALQDGEEILIGANKAVILGTGGFEHDANMRASYLSTPLIALQSCSGNTGDGHKMGMKVGAATAYMDRCWGLPHMYLGSANPREMILENESLVTLGNTNDCYQDGGQYRGLPGSIMVNSRGRRFANECAAYDPFNRAFGNFDTDTMSKANVPAYLIFDSTYSPAFGAYPGQNEDGSLPEAYVKADTLEELAEKLGIEVDGLVAEVTEFNAYAAEGKDPKFHRGEHEYDLYTNGGYAAMGSLESGTPNPVLSPIAKAPFYGVMYIPGTFGTCGGLRIDANSQVVSVDGETIPGLYAVGNCSSGVAGGVYAHGGMTVGSGSVMSWVAVRHILGVED